MLEGGESLAHCIRARVSHCGRCSHATCGAAQREERLVQAVLQRGGGGGGRVEARGFGLCAHRSIAFVLRWCCAVSDWK